MVERRREQAAEVVERHLERAAKVVPVPLLWRGARQGGVVEPRLPAAGRSGTSGRDKSRAFGGFSRADGFIQSFHKGRGVTREFRHA